MTFSRLKTTGSGKLALRLEIDGWLYSPVTAAAMETTDANSRIRKTGLSVRGVKLSESADLLTSKLEGKGVDITLADVGETWTAALNTDPTLVTWLASEAAYNASTLTVKSTTGWPSSGRLWLNSECIEYTGTTATTFTGCTRGRLGTLAQTHITAGSTASTAVYPEITNQPTLFEGRRARLYAYGAGNSPTGDGTQIWLGVVRGEPSMEGPAWRLFLDPIASILESEVGGDLGPAVTPRGVWLPKVYSPTPWTLQITRVAYASGTETTIPTPGLGGTAVEMDGFYETQEAFLEELNSRLATATSGWGTDITAVASEDGSYHFVYTTGASPDGVTLTLQSAPEPWFDGTVQSEGSTSYNPNQNQTSMLQNTTYVSWPNPRRSIAGAGMVPRGFFASGFYTPAPGGGAPVDSTMPTTRIYVGGASAVPTNTDLAGVTWQDGASSDEIIYRVTTSDTTDRYLELSLIQIGSDRPGEHWYTPANLPTIRLGREYNTTSYAGTGVYNLLKTLEDECPTQINRGAMPMITSGDWNSSEVLTAYSGGGIQAAAANRSYSSLTPVKLIDFIAPDLQLAGLYLATDTNGKLTVKPLRLAAPTETATFAITSSNLLTDSGMPQYERGAVGLKNTVLIRDGYDPISDDYTLPVHQVIDIAARGRMPKTRQVAIEPKSVGPRISSDEAVAIAAKLLGVFGGPYAYVTCSVPLTALDVRIGSTVSIDTAQLPSRSGTRGVDSLVGIVTSRDVDLYGSRITLTVLVSAARISGYAPSAKVSSQTNTLGDKWELTLSSSYFASGEDASDHFSSLDSVQVYRYDSATAGTLTGVVNTVAGNVVTVTFDSTWTPSTDEWVLTFDDADSANGDTANMRRYAYLAGTDGIVGFAGGTNLAAWQFAP